jgi:Amt family ammonium transporter
MGAYSRAATCGAVFGLVTLATPALADTAGINAADTAWMITATALVLMMTIRWR